MEKSTEQLIQEAREYALMAAEKLAQITEEPMASAAWLTSARGEAAHLAGKLKRMRDEVMEGRVTGRQRS